MAKTKSTSVKSIIISALVASAFVSAIAWGAFDDLTRVAIAAGITFVVVLLALSLLNWAAKDDNVKPGEPRLK
jgi:preprotein translocase subunit SecG